MYIGSKGVITPPPPPPSAEDGAVISSESRDDWASSWDYGTYHIGIRAVSPDSSLFAHSMEVDERSDQKSDI